MDYKLNKKIQKDNYNYYYNYKNQDEVISEDSITLPQSSPNKIQNSKKKIKINENYKNLNKKQIKNDKNNNTGLDWNLDIRNEIKELYNQEYRESLAFRNSQAFVNNPDSYNLKPSFPDNELNGRENDYSRQTISKMSLKPISLDRNYYDQRESINNLRASINTVSRLKQKEMDLNSKQIHSLSYLNSFFDESEVKKWINIILEKTRSYKSTADALLRCKSLLIRHLEVRDRNIKNLEISTLEETIKRLSLNLTKRLEKIQIMIQNTKFNKDPKNTQKGDQNTQSFTNKVKKVINI